MGVGDDAPQLVHRVVEVMHAPPLPGVDGQALNLKRRALEVLQTLKIGKFDNFIRKSDKRRHVYYSVIASAAFAHCPKKSPNFRLHISSSPSSCRPHL